MTYLGGRLDCDEMESVGLGFVLRLCVCVSQHRRSSGWVLSVGFFSPLVRYVYGVAKPDP